MPAPSVTYSFSNGTVADATQVNQNFTDLINGISDGTKDLSISALTVAGNFSATGSTNTIGNASSDDFVLTASLASTINIKTTATYNIGSATLGLAGIYFGANSQTVRIIGSGSMSATWTLTLPVSAGTANYIMITDGSGVSSWSNWTNSAWRATTSALGTNYFPNGMVRVHTGNGHGSTNTKIRRFTTELTATGTAITYADSAANGGSFTINESGVYTVSYCDRVNTGTANFGISVNTSEATTNIQSIIASNRFAVGTSAADYACVCVTMRLDAGDVVRAHTDGTPNNTAAAVQLTITQEQRS